MGTLTNFRILFNGSKQDKKSIKIGSKIVHLGDAAKNWMVLVSHIFKVVYGLTVKGPLLLFIDFSGVKPNTYLNR